MSSLLGWSDQKKKESNRFYQVLLSTFGDDVHKLHFGILEDQDRIQQILDYVAKEKGNLTTYQESYGNNSYTSEALRQQSRYVLGLSLNEEKTVIMKDTTDQFLLGHEITHLFQSPKPPPSYSVSSE